VGDSYHDVFMMIFLQETKKKEKRNKNYLPHIRKLPVGCCSGNALHLHSVLTKIRARGAQFVEALRYKTEGRGFDSR
jgi:hypothetical protein